MHQFQLPVLRTTYPVPLHYPPEKKERRKESKKERKEERQKEARRERGLEERVKRKQKKKLRKQKNKKIKFSALPNYYHVGKHGSVMSELNMPAAL